MSHDTRSALLALLHYVAIPALSFWCGALCMAETRRQLQRNAAKEMRQRKGLEHTSHIRRLLEYHPSCEHVA